MLVLDLDQFIPEEKVITLKGKSFNISEIPFELTLQVYDVLPTMTCLSEGKQVTKEDFDKIFKLIYSIFKISDPELEESWLKKLITLRRFNEIVPFIFQAMFDDGKKKEETPME